MPQTNPDVISCPAKKSRWKRRLTIGAVCLVPLWIFHAPLLTSYASLLTVRPASPEYVNAVVVGKSLGGTDAIVDAALLYESKQAEQILIVTEAPNRLHRMGILPTFEGLAQRILISRGVPASAITILDRRPAFHAWLQQNVDAQVLVHVGQFAAHKEAWAAHHEFGRDCAKRMLWRPTPDERFDPSNWWLHKQGVLSVFNESISLAHTLMCGSSDTECCDADADECDEWDVDQYEAELCRTVKGTRESSGGIQPRMHTN